MKICTMFAAMLALVLASSCSDNNPNTPYNEMLNIDPPVSTVKMVFIRGTTGARWLQSGYGNLGLYLNANNFYVTETDYGWQAAAVPSGCGNTQIGARTDTTDWPCWFNPTVMPYVFANHQNYAYTNNIHNPPAENEIVLFKSSYAMSDVGDFISDEKAVYNSLLNYFASRTDKLFILVIPPPKQFLPTADKTRELATWLADRNNGWLKNYTPRNVYAYDYYNVLTHPDNHHRINKGYEEHAVNNANNILYYTSSQGDSQPNPEGQQKATAEFIPLLKGWYNKWKGAH